MAKKSIEDFRNAIKKYKSVILRYYHYNGIDAELRYDMNQKGMVIEVFTYNRTCYGKCHIDSEDMAHHIDMEGVMEIIPTPSDMVKHFNVLTGEDLLDNNFKKHLRVCNSD